MFVEALHIAFAVLWGGLATASVRMYREARARARAREDELRLQQTIELLAPFPSLSGDDRKGVELALGVRAEEPTELDALRTENERLRTELAEARGYRGIK